jgi:hypothetical protein
MNELIFHLIKMLYTPRILGDLFCLLVAMLASAVSTWICYPGAFWAMVHTIFTGEVSPPPAPTGDL